MFSRLGLSARFLARCTVFCRALMAALTLAAAPIVQATPYATFRTSNTPSGSSQYEEFWMRAYIYSGGIFQFPVTTLTGETYATIQYNPSYRDCMGNFHSPTIQYPYLTARQGYAGSTLYWTFNGYVQKANNSNLCGPPYLGTYNRTLYNYPEAYATGYINIV